MKFHDTLNEKLFDLNTNDMLPEVREKLKEIADEFVKFLEIPEDAVLDEVITGSSASYNYNKYSDLDLHIIVDYDKVHEDCPLVSGYLNSLKKQFNDNHDIFIHGVPVELYAEQKDQGTVHNGLYSLNTGWTDKPQKIAPTDNDAAVEAKFNEIKELVDKCEDSEEAQELIDKIYNMRKAGLAEAGEFCTENLAFKKLRIEGCMEKLRKIKKEQIDKQLSLESYNEAVKELNSSENEKLIKQIFPQATHTFVMLDNDRGHISFELPIEGGRKDNEFVIWIFNNKIDIRYTNYSLGGVAYVDEIETDINFSEFESKLTEILEMVKPNIENYYKKLVQKQTTITSEEDEDNWEEELSNFISKLPNTLKLSKLYDVDITDGTVYVNCDKYPNNTVFIEPIEDSTQLIKIGLLDDSNMEVTSEELELGDFGKEDIQNIRVTVKELFNSKNESIKEPKNYNEAEDLPRGMKTKINKACKDLRKAVEVDIDEWCRSRGWGRGPRLLKQYLKNNRTCWVYYLWVNDGRWGHCTCVVEVDWSSGDIVFNCSTTKESKISKMSNLTTKNLDEFVEWFKNTFAEEYFVHSYIKESIKESLQSEYKQAFDLLVEGENIVGTLDTDFGKQFVKDVENLYKLKSYKLKLSVAKEMLKDIQGYLVDEQYDGYNAKIDKFMNNSKNESIKEGFNKGDKVQLKRKNNKIGIVKSIFNGDKDKNNKDIKYLDVEFEDGTKEGRPASDFKKVNESIKEKIESKQKLIDVGFKIENTNGGLANRGCPALKVTNGDKNLEYFIMLVGDIYNIDIRKLLTENDYDYKLLKRIPSSRFPIYIKSEEDAYNWILADFEKRERRLNMKSESIKEELNIGDKVKIKVATSGLKPRTGTITKKISGDVFEVNIDADNSNMERTDRYYSQDLEKIDSEPIKEDSIEGIVNSLINKYGKEKLQKGLQTPYQKDYVWGLLHREKGLDLTAILNCLKSKLNESIKEDTYMDKYKPMYDKATELAQDKAKIDFVSKMNPQELVNYATKAIKQNDADISDVENMLYKANYTPGQIEDILDMIRTNLDEAHYSERNKNESIKESKMENLDRALFQVGKELGDMELTPTVDAILGRMCELMGLPYDAADEIAWIKEAAEKWIDLLGNKPLAPVYMKGSISARATFYQFVLDRYKRQYEQAIGMDEDVDTLEKKMDDVDTTLKDLMDKINGMSEEVEDTEFDIDKANKLIDEALRED